MRPDVSTAAAVLGDLLATDIAPALTGFRANNAGMIGLMMKMMAEEWDRAASRLVEENAAIRVLLRQGGEDALAGDEDRDLRVSILEAENDRLRAALIVLHARCETAEGAEARALEEAIWDELRRSVERRRISLANF